MRHLPFLSIVILCGSLLLVGCGDDDSSNPDDDDAVGHPPAAMVGEWIFRSVTVGGAADDLATVLEWQPSTVSANIQILANSAYVYEEVNAQGGQLWFESGFVFVDGNEIDVNAQQDGSGSVMETTFMTYTLAGGVLTLVEDDGGAQTAFTLTMP